MKSQLLNKIRTVEEKDVLKSEINKLLDSLYTEKGSGFESALKSKVRFWVSEIIKSEVNNDYIEIEGYLKAVLENLDKFEVVSVKIAFEPTDSAIDRFFNFIKTEVGEMVIMAFELDRKILGGAVISYKGDYRDLSLKRLFEDEYEAKRDEVMKIMYSR